MCQRLSVVLDPLAPDRGAFPQAVSWGAHLQVPVQGIAVRPASSLRQHDQAAYSPLPHEIGKSCAAICRQNNVRWELSDRSGPDLGEAWSSIRRDDLLIFGRGLAHGEKKQLLRHAQRSNGPGVLICPDDMPALRRILLVQQDNLQEEFLRIAVGLCRCFQAGLVVLSVARSNRAAQTGEQAARRALANAGIETDFDVLVGSEVRVAVAHVARWRHCQLVVMQGERSNSWWRWLRGTPAEEMMDLAASLSFLSLPLATAPQLTVEWAPPTACWSAGLKAGSKGTREKTGTAVDGLSVNLGSRLV